jgi:hypothetical protein
LCSAIIGPAELTLAPCSTPQAVTIEKWQGFQAPGFIFEEAAMINTATQVGIFEYVCGLSARPKVDT